MSQIIFAYYGTVAIYRWVMSSLEPLKIYLFFSWILINLRWNMSMSTWQLVRNKLHRKDHRQADKLLLLNHGTSHAFECLNV